MLSGPGLWKVGSLELGSTLGLLHSPGTQEGCRLGRGGEDGEQRQGLLGLQRLLILQGQVLL